MSAVTAVDSSGETAKQAAESKKWLAVAALIPDHTPPGTQPDQDTPCIDGAVHHKHSQTNADTLPVVSQDQNQSIAGIHHLGSDNISKDRMLHQQPSVCNQTVDSIPQTPSAASVTDEAAVSDASLSSFVPASEASNHSASQGPHRSQPASAEYCAEVPASLHQTACDDETQSYSDRRAPGSDVLPPIVSPAQACGKA